MALHETEALVLKSYALAEADKIVVFLTRSHGIVRGVAKGAKRLTSRFGGSLEPFSIVRLEFFQSGERELVTIKRAEIVESLFLRASDPSLLTDLSYFSDVLTSFSAPSDPDDRVYRMTRGCLEAAMADPASITRLLAYFEYWMLYLGGFLPSWTACSHCGRMLADAEEAGLRADFRLTCAACERIRRENRISPGARGLTAAIRRLAPAAFVAETAENEFEIAELSAIFKKMIAGVLGREAARV